MMKRMDTDILNRGPSSEARTHALVIGVSHYRYFPGGPSQSAKGTKWGLEQLSAAASSAAAVARFLLTEYHQPHAELATLRVLLSPQANEPIDDQIAPMVAGPQHRATRENVKAALKAFFADCESNVDNVAFVYIAGHGVQLTKHGAIVLLEDAADEDHLNDLEGAIDVVACQEGMDNSLTASTQFWFVDACRQLPEVAEQFETMDGALHLDPKKDGFAKSTSVFFGASPREVSFAYPGKKTLLCTALLEALSGNAAVDAGDGSGEWTVLNTRLAESLTARVAELAAAAGEAQNIDPGGRMVPAVVHRLKSPSVRLTMYVDPATAASSTSASLLLNANEPVPDLPSHWPIDIEVRPGLYLLKVKTGPLALPPRNRILDLKPRTAKHRIEVADVK